MPGPRTLGMHPRNAGRGEDTKSATEMKGMVPVGIALPPDIETLELIAPLIEEAEYFEVTPETLWRARADGELEPNGFHGGFLDLRERSGKPFVAHGVGLSVGSSPRSDAFRRQRWMQQIRLDHEQFKFGWYTDHLGATALHGLA